MTDFDSGDRPQWWQRNEELRTSLELPEYEPPRFSDGTYTHAVLEDLETELGCEIRFMAVNPEYEDDWDVRIDGSTAFRIGRHRDESANTVYEMTPAEFEDRVRAATRD